MVWMFLLGLIVGLFVGFTLCSCIRVGDIDDELEEERNDDEWD